MVTLAPWFERQWSFTLPVDAFPAVLERLAGTPARAAALVAGAPERILAVRPAGKWSVKDHLGHLSDLHDLDMQRIDDFLAGAEALSVADLSNRRTETAGHGTTPLAELLQRLQRDREALFHRLETLSTADIAATSRHPRLGITMRLIDWAQFVAEHDDHHLASARHVLRSLDERA